MYYALLWRGGRLKLSNHTKDTGGLKTISCCSTVSMLVNLNKWINNMLAEYFTANSSQYASLQSTTL